MLYNFSSTKGFTLIEMMVVVSIISLIVSVTTLSMSKTRGKHSIEEGEITLVRTLEEARSRSMAGVSGSGFGVRIENNVIKIFKGSSYTPVAVTFETVLPSPVITDQSGMNVIFEKLSGKTASTTITLTNPSTTDQKKIYIKENGQISIQ